MIHLHLDQTSGVPYYVQLIQQVHQALLFDQLHPGDQLPTVKEAVRQVAVNPNTVLRAYRELEHDGLVISRPGLGTFVASTLPEPLASATYQTLRRDLERWLDKGRQLGVSDQMLTSLFNHLVRKRSEGAVA